MLTNWQIVHSRSLTTVRFMTVRKNRTLQVPRVVPYQALEKYKALGNFSKALYGTLREVLAVYNFSILSCWHWKSTNECTRIPGVIVKSRLDHLLLLGKGACVPPPKEECNQTRESCRNQAQYINLAFTFPTPLPPLRDSWSFFQLSKPLDYTGKKT